MGSLMMDFRYALRTLMRSPGFTIVAVLALALGIGANTALFSVVNALLLRPLPFPNPDRLVLLWCGKPDEGANRLPASFLNFYDIRDQSHAFDSMAALFAYANTSFNLSAGDEPERIQAAYASADLFRTLGTSPLLGRTYLPGEDRHGGARVVVLGHDLWRRRFASDPSLVSRQVSLDGEGYTVLGIMPAGFTFPKFPRDADAWVPLGLDPRHGRTFSRGTSYLTIIARLGAGVALERARAEMDAIAARMRHDNPGPDTGLALRVVPLQSQVTGDLRPALLILLGAAGLVLLIACAN